MCTSYFNITNNDLGENILNIYYNNDDDGCNNTYDGTGMTRFSELFFNFHIFTMDIVYDVEDDENQLIDVVVCIRNNFGFLINTRIM